MEEKTLDLLQINVHIPTIIELSHKTKEFHPIKHQKNKTATTVAKDLSCSKTSPLSGSKISS